MTRTAVGFGPRLVATPTGRLRCAVLVRPNAGIERTGARIGEPGAIYARALEQHDVLRSTLEYLGVETIVLGSHASDAYEVSAGDAAVVFEDGAVMMRPTAMSRRAEADRMQAEFAVLDVPLAGHIASPGLLDGNDVILAGETAFIGVGSQGNEAGRAGFAKLAQSHGYRVVEVKLAAGRARAALGRECRRQATRSSSGPIRPTSPRSPVFGRSCWNAEKSWPRACSVWVNGTCSPTSATARLWDRCDARVSPSSRSISTSSRS